MKMIVGLGNPGKKYDKTRHNAGFFVIDEVLKELKLNLDLDKFNALYTITTIGNEKVMFVKPQTFMNASGEAVSALMSYYGLQKEDLIVIHDDLDLPVGKLRLRMAGSSGGQKGMGNIIDLLHTQEIKRIRIGISNNKQIDTKDYVLGKFSKEEFVIYKETVMKAKDAVIYSLDHDFDLVMNKYNG